MTGISKPKILAGRLLWLILVILLTIYAPLELTLVIVESEFIRCLHPEIPQWQFIAELIFLWSFYVAAMVIIGRKLCLT